jgi:hypothetical protein
MNLSKALSPHRSELMRALRNHKYEPAPGGLLVPQFGLIAGCFETAINGKDWQVDANLIVTEGLNLTLDSLMPGGAGKQWYVALFSTNTNPVAGLTGATWVGAQTEFTGYAEATRVAYENGVAAGGIIDNDADRAEFSINATATVYGGALCEAQAKSGVTGKLLACSKFATGRSVVSGDTLQVKYTLTVTP